MVRTGSAAAASRPRRRCAALGAGLLAALGLGACAPTIQHASRPPAEFSGPRLVEHGFYSFDGVRIPGQFYEPPNGQAPFAVMIALHGMNDYSEAFWPAGKYWADHGVAVYAYDQRGFGKTNDRGIWPGRKLLAQDLNTLIALVRARHPGAPLCVLGDSMGAAVAMEAQTRQDAPAVDRVVLVAPAVWGWRELPMRYRVVLWLSAHVVPQKKVSAPRRVQRRITASDNTEMLRRIGRDRWMLFETRVDALYGLVQLMNEASKRAPNLAAPTMFLYGAKDQIIPKKAARAAAQALPPNARTVLYANGYHMLLRDLQAQIVYDDVLAFLRDPEAPLPSGAPAFILPSERETLTASR